MNIGIIGQGFVGNAVYQKFKNYYDVLTYDLDESKSNSNVNEIICKCTNIFICLPTPMNKDGSCNISIVESVLAGIDLTTDNLETKRNIIILLNQIIWFLLLDQRVQVKPILELQWQ